MLAHKVSGQRFPRNTDIQKFWLSCCWGGPWRADRTQWTGRCKIFLQCCGEASADYQCSDESPLDGNGLVNHCMDRCLKCKHEMKATYKEVYMDKQKKARYWRSVLSSLSPLSPSAPWSLHIFQSPAQLSARNTNIIPVNTNTNLLMFTHLLIYILSCFVCVCFT